MDCGWLDDWQIFMTGHGGDGFLKFQDFEELSSQDIADSIQEMHVKKRCVTLCVAGKAAQVLSAHKSSLSLSCVA